MFIIAINEMYHQRFEPFIVAAAIEARKVDKSMISSYGAVLVYHNEIIAVGHNEPIPNGHFVSNYGSFVGCKYSTHAEQNCINNFLSRFKDDKKDRKLIKNCIMILVKLTTTANVLPCHKCQCMLNKYGIRTVYCVPLNKSELNL